MRVLLVIIKAIFNFNAFGQFKGNEITNNSVFGIKVSDISFKNCDSLFSDYSYRKVAKSTRNIKWQNGGCSLIQTANHYLKFKRNKLILSVIETDGKVRIKVILLKIGDDLIFEDIIFGKTKPEEIKNYSEKWYSEKYQIIEYKNVLLGIKINTNADWKDKPIMSIEI